MFASTKQAGNLMATPDTCKTPAPPGSPIPVPYPNTTMCTMANGGTVSMKVKFANKEAVTKKTMIPTSQGDEAGVAGGVVSGVIMNQAKFTTCSFKVKIEGQPAVMMSAMAMQNGSNANAPPGTQISPSQTKVDIGG